MEQARHRSFLIRVALGALLAAAPLAAPAQTVAGAATVSFSKSSAILGGASRLEALLASQGVAPVADNVPTPASATPMIAAVARLPDAPLPPAQPVSQTSPDIFNSVALSVARSPLDSRWRAVRGGSPGARASAVAAALAGQDEMARLEAINRFVNDRVRFTEDRAQFGAADRWSSAADTLARGRGDCEDYAIAKLQMLRRAGFAERDLYLAVVKDLVRRADHAVLVVRSGGRFWVLDNGTDRVLDDRAIADYRPVLTFSAGKVYTHGYRRQSPALPPLVIASASYPAAPLAPAASPSDGLPEVARTPILADLLVPTLNLGAL